MKFLRTEYAALFGILLILLATVKHSFEVYVSVMYLGEAPSYWQMFYVAIMLLAVDYAVLQFTIHGNDYAAQTFAFFIFLLNLYAFWEHLAWPGWGVGLLRYFPGIIFSGMFAYGLYYFTDIFSQLLQDRQELESLQDERESSKAKISHLENELSLKTETLDQLSMEKEDLVLQLESLKENQKNFQSMSSNYQLLLNHFIDVGGFKDKSDQALRKGVEYWRKKADKGEIDEKGRVKMLAYEATLKLKERR